MPDYWAGSSEGDREYSEMCDRQQREREEFAEGSLAIEASSNHEIVFHKMPKRICGVFAPQWPEDAVALLMRGRDGHISLYLRKSDYPPRGDDWLGYAFITIREDAKAEAVMQAEIADLKSKAVGAGLVQAEIIEGIFVGEIHEMKRKGYDWPRARKVIRDRLEKAASEAAKKKLRDSLQ